MKLSVEKKNKLVRGLTMAARIVLLAFLCTSVAGWVMSVIGSLCHLRYPARIVDFALLCAAYGTFFIVSLKPKPNTK